MKYDRNTSASGDLRPHLDASTNGQQKFNTSLRDGLKQVDEKDDLLLLVIEDTGTTGLTGPEREDGHFDGKGNKEHPENQTLFRNSHAMSRLVKRIDIKGVNTRSM